MKELTEEQEINIDGGTANYVIYRVKKDGYLHAGLKPLGSKVRVTKGGIRLKKGQTVTKVSSNVIMAGTHSHPNNNYRFYLVQCGTNRGYFSESKLERLK